MNRSHQVGTPHRSSRPPVLTPIDKLIDRNQGSSVALEATQERMEASKDSANTYFFKETKEVVDLLQQAVFEWRKAQKDIDNEDSDYGVETGSIKVVMNGVQ
jgi:hypothetical protein